MSMYPDGESWSFRRLSPGQVMQVGEVLKGGSDAVAATSGGISCGEKGTVGS